MKTEKARHPLPQKTSSSEDDAWLARPSTIRLLWWVFSAVLLLCVSVQLLFKVKASFGMDGWFGFGALYGFLSCVLMVLFAKALGRFLKRDENYHRVDKDD
jgi:hypothetical protein